jgi:uncharacterized membrane protein
MLWMSAYHFCFDLNHFGYFRQDFYEDPLWTWQRTGIVSLFLLCAGIGQALALRNGQDWPRFWRRWAHVAGCALLVSAGSWLMFPRSWISFGVLHAMAVMLLLARWLLARGWLRGITPWLAGALLVWGAPWLGELLRTDATPALQAAFDSRWLNWLGVVTRKPITEDYVPLLPWFGVLLWGAGAGQVLGRLHFGGLRQPLWGHRVLAVLARLGRWSLSYYMIHQPVLIGALLVFGWLLRRSGS